MTAELIEFPVRQPGSRDSFDPDTGIQYVIAPGEYWVEARDRALRAEIKRLREQLRNVTA